MTASQIQERRSKKDEATGIARRCWRRRLEIRTGVVAPVLAAEVNAGEVKYWG